MWLRPFYRSRFRTLVSIYGARIELWPAHEQADGRGFMRHAPKKAAADLEVARNLDIVLGSVKPLPVSEESQWRAFGMMLSNKTQANFDTVLASFNAVQSGAVAEPLRTSQPQARPAAAPVVESAPDTLVAQRAATFRPPENTPESEPETATQAPPLVSPNWYEAMMGDLAAPVVAEASESADTTAVPVPFSQGILAPVDDWVAVALPAPVLTATAIPAANPGAFNSPSDAAIEIREERHRAVGRRKLQFSKME